MTFGNIGAFNTFGFIRVFFDQQTDKLHFVQCRWHSRFMAYMLKKLYYGHVDDLSHHVLPTRSAKIITYIEICECTTYMHVYTHACIHTYMHTYIHTYIYIYIMHIYIYSIVKLYAFTQIYAHGSVFIHY